MAAPTLDVRVRITRVLLADDQELYREQVRALLASEPDMQVIGEAGDGQTAVRLTGDLQPDAVIMDIGMPHLNGIDATRRITESFPEIKVLALSMHSHRRFVDSMLAAGASGYVLKENALNELAGAVRAVMDGGTFLCPELS